MKKSNIKIIIALLCCIVGICVGCTNESNGDSEKNSGACETHVDANNDGKCDVCKADYTSTPQNVQLTFYIKDQDGATIEGVTVSLYKENEEEALLEGIPDDGGVVKATVVGEGTYTIRVDSAPEGYLGTPMTVEVSAEKNTFDMIVECTTPNGTKERPFVIIEETTEYVIPGGETYYFLVNGSDQILKIQNPNIELHYGEQVYTPNADGKIELPVVSASLREPVYFSVVNKSDDENSLTLVFQTKPGTVNNPYEIGKLGATITAKDIPNGGNVYYHWVCTESGVLTVSSKDPHNTIMLYNTTTMAVSSYTDGTQSVSLNVNAGDEISIIVASISTDEYSDVTFVLTHSK